MTITYLGMTAIAARTGLSVNTLKSYLRKGLLPAPDAVIESPTGQIRGWTQETIDEWLTSRPGRGNRAAHTNRERRRRAPGRFPRGCPLHSSLF